MPENLSSSEKRTIRAKALELAIRTAQEAPYYPTDRALRHSSITQAMTEQQSAILSAADGYADFIANGRTTTPAPGRRR